MSVPAEGFATDVISHSHHWRAPLVEVNEDPLSCAAIHDCAALVPACNGNGGGTGAAGNHGPPFRMETFSNSNSHAVFRAMFVA